MQRVYRSYVRKMISYLKQNMMSYLQYQNYVINILFREEVICTTKPYFTYIFKIKHN